MAFENLVLVWELAAADTAFFYFNFQIKIFNKSVQGTIKISKSKTENPKIFPETLREAKEEPRIFIKKDIQDKPVTTTTLATPATTLTPPANQTERSN